MNNDTSAINPLENEAIYIFREVAAQFENPVLLFSGGKDSITLVRLAQAFKVDLPEPLIEAVSSCQNNKAVRQVGIEWCIEQSKELLEANVPVLHYYSMGKSDNIKAIFSALK